MNELVTKVANSFSYIGPEHSFYPHVRRFKSLFFAHPLCAQLAEEFHGGNGSPIRASLNARLTSEQAWQFKWLYFSFQFSNGSQPRPFRAVTVYYSGNTDQMDCYEFPKDPYLTGMADFLNGTSSVDILRYVPKRRLTFRSSACSATPIVGKFSRRPQAAASYERLVAVSRAVQCSRPAFSVAAPLGFVESKSLFFQEAKPGDNLAALLKADNFIDLLRFVGVIHRDIHSLTLPDLSPWDQSSFLEDVTKAIKWISFLRPEHGPFLNEVWELLVNRTPPVDLDRYVCCHGDFSCPQILQRNDQWSVVDFDRCMRGDPYWEIARLIAFMKYDVPLFRDWFRHPDPQVAGRLEQAAESYLRGYEERTRAPLDRRRLVWYRICFEIEYLVRLFNRDLIDPPALDRGIALIHRLSETFRKEKGGDF